MSVRGGNACAKFIDFFCMFECVVFSERLFDKMFSGFNVHIKPIGLKVRMVAKY